MSSVDERVVEMRFDNKKFESGVSTSINSIEKLKKSMKFEETGKELEKFEKSTNSMKFSGLQNSFNTSVENMSIWAIAKFELIRRTVDKVTDSIERCVKSLSVDQVMSGWKKYEEKTQAVATLIAQGYDMTEVNDQLTKLNWYTDQTSYNFSSMATEIGKFTAAGKKLTDSVTAIMGVANWAALSGQNAGVASRAMIQLSQAIGRTFRYEDWKSLSNLSMDTKEFRQNCLDAGVALGTLRDNLDGTYTSLVHNQGAFSINEMLDHLTQDAWMTSEVQMEIYKNYASAVDAIYEKSGELEGDVAAAIEELGDEVSEFGVKAFLAAQEARTWTDVIDATKDAVSTGWMNIFENIFGSYEKQKEIWGTLVEDMWTLFAKPLDRLNSILAEWRALGGRTDLIEGIVNIFTSLKNVLAAVKQGFRDLFPGMTAKSLADATYKFKQLTEKLFITEEAAKKVRTAVQLLMIPLRVFVNLIRNALRVVSIVASVAIQVVMNFRQIIEAVDTAMKSSEKFAAVWEKLTRIFNAVKSILSAAKEAVKDFIANFNGVDSIAKLAAKIVQAVQTFGPQVVQAGIDICRGLVTGIIQGIPKVIQSAVEMGRQFLAAFDEYMGIHSPAREGIERGENIGEGTVIGVQNTFDKMGSAAKALGQRFLDGFDNFFKSDFGSKIKGIFASIKQTFDGGLPAIGTRLKEFVSNLTLGKVVSAAFAAGLVALAATVVKSVWNIVNTLKGAASVLEGFGSFMTDAGKMLKSLGKSVKNFSKGTVFTSFAIAMGTVVASILLLTFIPWDKAWKGAAATAGIMVALTVLVAVLNKILSSTEGMDQKISNFAKTMRNMALAMGIMAVAMLLLTIPKWEKVAVAAVALSAVMLAMAFAAKIMAKADKDVTETAKSMVKISLAILIFAKAVTNLTKIDFTWPNLVKAVVGLGLIIGTVALLAAIVKKDGDSIKGAGIGLLAVSAAMLVLIMAIKRVSRLKFEKDQWISIGIKMAALLAVLTALAFILKIAGEGAKDVGIGVLALAAGIVILTAAFKRLSKIEMPTADLKGIRKALGILVLTLGGLLLISNIPTKKIKGIAAIIIGFVAIVLAMAVLAHQPVDGISAAATGIFVVMITIMLTLALGREAKLTGSLLAVVALIISIVVALSVLQIYPIKQLLPYAIILLALIGVIVAGVAFASKITDVKPMYTVLALVVALVAIAAVLAKLSTMELNTTNLIVTAASIAGIMLALSLCIAMASKIKDMKPMFTILALIGMVIVIAVSINMVAPCDPVNVIAAAVAIGLVAVLMATSAKIANNALKGAVTMLLLVVSTIAIAVTLSLMAKAMDQNGGIANVLVAAGAISGVMLLLAVAALIANGAIVGAAAMVILATSALLVGLALAALCKVADPKEMWNACLAVAACLGLLTVLAAAFTIFPVLYAGIPALAALAGVLLLVSGSMTLAGVAFNLFAFAMDTLANTIIKIAPILPLFGQSVAMMIETVTAALIVGAQNLSQVGFILAFGIGYNLIAGFIGGIFSGFGDVAESATSLGSVFLTVLRSVLGIHSPAWMTTVIGILTGQGFVNGVDSMDGEAASAASLLGDSALGGLAGLAEKFFGAGQTAGNNFGSGLMSTVQKYADQFGIDIGGIGQLLGLGNKKTRDQLVKELETAQSAYSATYKSWKKGSGNDTATVGMVREALDGIVAARQALADFDARAETSAADTSSVVEDLMEDVTDALDMDDLAGGGGGGGGGSAAVEDIVTSFETMDDTILDVLDSYSELEDVFNDPEAIRKAEDAVLSFGAALIDASNDGKELSEQMEMTIENMEKSLRDFKKSIKDNLTGALTGFEEFDRGAIHSAQELIDNLEDQKQALLEWATNLNAMRELGYSETVIKKITDMGISAGFGWAEALAQSTDAERASIESAFSSMTMLIDTSTDSITTTLASSMSNFGNLYHGVAYDAVDGFLDGFRERYSEVSEVGHQLGLAALSGTREALDSHSPSREFASIGNDSVDGYILQMSKRLRDVRNATGSLFETSATTYASMLQKAIDTASATIQDGELEAPTIRLSIDDNDALQALANLRKSLNGNLPVDMSVTGKLAQLAIPNDGEVYYPNRRADESVTNNYTYTQNNYSPKALSAVEIYRHTNRLINAGKER